MAKRIQSFTIIELIMSLLISSVVIGIVFYVYLLFSQQFLRYQHRSMQINEYYLLRKALQGDMDKASAILQPSPESIACAVENSGQAIAYHFLDSVVVRDMGEATDSFRIRNKVAQVVFVNEESTPSAVDKIVLHIVIDGNMFDAIFTKRYSADQLLKQPNTNE